MTGRDAPDALRVRVAASSANLGPGFDHLGLALALDLEIRVSAADRDRFAYRGEGGDDAIPDDPENLVHRGFRAVWAALDRDPPPVRIEAWNAIPLARGLGSSSAALVAGAAAAETWAAASGSSLGRDGVFQLCAELEGHPDNIAPAVYGGFTVSARDPEGGYASVRLDLPTSWHLLFGVPDFELSTEAARRALPDTVGREDAVATASRSALWTYAVARDRPDLLPVASRDVLHEPYREALVPGLAEARSELRRAGAWAAFLSGAGPTVGVVCASPRIDACRESLQRFVGREGRVLELRPGQGYRVVHEARDGAPAPGTQAGTDAVASDLSESPAAP